MLFSMGVDWWRSRTLGRIATKYDSQALEADALHFSTDIWSAGVVVLGLALVLAGRTYHIRWLRDSDPIAALFVAGVVDFGELAPGPAHHRCACSMPLLRAFARRFTMPSRASMECLKSIASAFAAPEIVTSPILPSGSLAASPSSAPAN